MGTLYEYEYMKIHYLQLKELYYLKVFSLTRELE